MKYRDKYEHVTNRKETLNPPYYHSLEGQKMQPEPRQMRREKKRAQTRELKKFIKRNLKPNKTLDNPKT